MLKRVALLLIPFVSVIFLHEAYAMPQGLYLGVSLGPASNSASEKTAYTINYQTLCPATSPCIPTPTSTLPTYSTLLAKPKATMFGSRIMVGYQFNDYAALEGGIDYFSNIRYTTGSSPACSPLQAPPGGVGTGIVPNADPCSPTSSTTAGARGVDLVFKGSIPLNNFDIYGKIGPMYVVSELKGAFAQPVFNTNLLPGQPYPTRAGTQTNAYFKPVFTLGADYILSQSWVADLAYTHLSVGQGINSVNYFSLGIAYHFVSKFCGQFLCDD